MVARADEGLDEDARRTDPRPDPSRPQDPSNPAPMRRGRRSEPRQHEALAIEPERDRVRVWCRGALDTFAATRLRDECNGLLERGFTRLVLDLSRATSIGPAGVTTIAATDQRARTLGARLSVVPPTGTAAETLRRSGLLGQLHLEGARDDIFWDWSR